MRFPKGKTPRGIRAVDPDKATRDAVDEEFRRARAAWDQPQLDDEDAGPRLAAET